MVWNMMKEEEKTKPAEKPTESVGMLSGEEGIEGIFKKEGIKAYNVDELPKRRGLKVLVYGKTGTGKTRFCMLSENPIYMIDTENRASVLAELCKGKKVTVFDCFRWNKENYEIDSVETLKEIEKAVYFIGQQKDVKTICIDSISTVWYPLMADWLRQLVLRTRGTTTKKGKPTLQGALETPSVRMDWARATSKHMGMLMGLNSMNANVILTAKSHPVYDNSGNLTGTYEPKIQKDVMFLVDIAIELFTRLEGTETKYFGRVTKCAFPTKGVVGTVIENPDFSKVKDLIFGKEAK